MPQRRKRAVGKEAIQICGLRGRACPVAVIAQFRPRHSWHRRSVAVAGAVRSFQDLTQLPSGLPFLTMAFRPPVRGQIVRWRLPAP